jgi:hypothetical protein
MSIQPIQPLQGTSNDPVWPPSPNSTATTGVARAALHAGAIALGMAPSSLNTALQQGSSLPAVAKQRGAPADRAKDAMDGTLRQKLEAGVITQPQYARLQQLAAELATGKLSYSQYIVQSSVV